MIRLHIARWVNKLLKIREDRYYNVTPETINIGDWVKIKGMIFEGKVIAEYKKTYRVQFHNISFHDMRVKKKDCKKIKRNGISEKSKAQ